MIKKRSKAQLSKEAREEILRRFREMGIVTEISEEEMNRRIREGIPGNYVHKGIPIYISNHNPIEPEDDEVF